MVKKFWTDAQSNCNLKLASLSQQSLRKGFARVRPIMEIEQPVPTEYLLHSYYVLIRQLEIRREIYLLNQLMKDISDQSISP